MFLFISCNLHHHQNNRRGEDNHFRGETRSNNGKEFLKKSYLIDKSYDLTEDERYLFIKILFTYVYSVEFFCSSLSSNPNGFSTSKAALEPLIGTKWFSSIDRNRLQPRIPKTIFATYILVTFLYQRAKKSLFHWVKYRWSPGCL